MKISTLVDERTVQFRKGRVKIAPCYPFHFTDHESAAWIFYWLLMTPRALSAKVQTGGGKGKSCPCCVRSAQPPDPTAWQGFKQGSSCAGRYHQITGNVSFLQQGSSYIMPVPQAIAPLEILLPSSLALIPGDPHTLLRFWLLLTNIPPWEGAIWITLFTNMHV